MTRGTGVRDVDQRQGHSRTTAEGWLYRQDSDMMRRWRKWWCAVKGGELTCTLYDSLRLSEPPSKEQRAAAAPSAADAAAAAGGGGSTRSTRSATLPSAPPSPGARGAEGTPSPSGLRRWNSTSCTDFAEPPPCKALQTVSVPLAMATVREARQLAVPYAIEVISPQQSLTLQAQSQEEMHGWVETIQNVTARELGCGRSARMSITSLSRTVLGQVRHVEGNASCADCDAENPAWASINLGVTLCLACAGVHRQLGTHISKVRSLELDTKEWSVPLLAVMTGLGNEPLNRLWQPRLGSRDAAARPTKASNAAQREAFIRQKYEARAFVDGAASPPAGSIHLAALRDDVLLCASCLTHGGGAVLEQPAPAEDAAGVAEQWGAEAARRHAGRTPLHVAASEGSTVVLELLLQNLCGEVDAAGPEGKTALKLAVEGGHSDCVDQLITRAANISAADSAGATPMQAAAELGHDAILNAMLAYKLAQDEKLLSQEVHTLD